MKKLTTIVVEDERLPRLSLLAKLEGLSHCVEVVDSCDSYEAARNSILRHRPDLLFLDIQLHGRDSIQLLEELKQTIALPYVIFTTAYTDRNYLMSAIKLAAVDYLLKPIDKALLEHAVAKAMDRARAAMPRDEGKLVFKTASGVLRLAPGEIACAKADGNYARVVTFNDENLVMESLLSLEQKLPQNDFLRADRSTIVNTSMIYQLNQRQQTCTLKSGDGRVVKLPLTKHGIAVLMATLQ